MWRIVIAIILLMHGIGHVMGIFPIFGLWTIEGQNSRSWLLTNLLGEGGASWFSLLLWLAAMVGFVGAGLALLGWGVPLIWWRPFAIWAAFISIIGLILYWNAFFTIVNKVGALGVDIAILVALLWMHWPTEAMFATS